MPGPKGIARCPPGEPRVVRVRGWPRPLAGRHRGRWRAGTPAKGAANLPRRAALLRLAPAPGGVLPAGRPPHDKKATPPDDHTTSPDGHDRRRRPAGRARPRGRAGLGGEFHDAADHPDRVAGRAAGRQPRCARRRQCRRQHRPAGPGQQCRQPGRRRRRPGPADPARHAGRRAGPAPACRAGSAGPQARSADSRDGTPAPNPPSRANTGTGSPAEAGSASQGGGQGSGQAGVPDRSRQGSAQQPPAGAEAARPGDGGTTLAAFTVDGGALRSGRRASKLIGSTVYNENNESVGEVDDILIVPGGAGPVAVVSVGGFLGIGAKLVAVPYDRLQPAGGGNNRWTLTGATKESLGSLPTFTYGSTGERKG
ncbi:hypothetical protein CKO45_31680 [Paracraurococcus ruber]|uniref:PRC-barrel domain-containing protein n=1 Tax=Paracraurococcus ruber TaxID=77675 RepID=A0ABS1D8Q1_9PROT|nr:PRC-barrel domain-containing protein [Paracraurococcus ruber]MBK1662735.1 hypothetical protein [Paracraurococcus ruber]